MVLIFVVGLNFYVAEFYVALRLNTEATSNSAQPAEALTYLPLPTKKISSESVELATTEKSQLPKYLTLAYNTHPLRRTTCSKEVLFPAT